MVSGVSGGAGQIGFVLRKADQVDPAREVGSRAAFAACMCLGTLVLGRRKAQSDGHVVDEPRFRRDRRASAAAGRVSHAINIRTD